MTTGTIKWYDPTKGFGFVAPEGSASDLFLHRSSLASTLDGDPAEGDKVTFDEGTSDRGPVAVNVVIIERSGIPARQRSERSSSYGDDSYGSSSSYGGSSSYDSRSSSGGGYGSSSSYGAPRSSSRTSVTPEELANAPVGQGTVKRYDSERGFGFIGQDSGDDIFVHHSALNGATIQPGDKVEFKVVSSAKGPRAEEVRRTED